MAVPHESEVRLIRRAARGDTDAFTALFDQHQRAVYNYALWLCGDSDLAEDLTQDAFIRAHANLHRLGPPWKLRAWLFRLLRNLYIDHRRRTDPTYSLDPDAPLVSPEPDPERQVLSAELSSPVAIALQRLSPQNREALVLREVHGLAYADIADVMGISLDSVKVVLHRARERFREVYSLRLLAEDPLPRCAVLNELLDAHADGELLTPQQEALVREHIKTCPTCQQRKREIAALVVLLRGLPQPTPTPRLRSRTLKRTSARHRAGRLAHFARLLGVALLEAVLIVGLWPVTVMPPPPPATPTEEPAGYGGGEEPTPTAVISPPLPTEPSVGGCGAPCADSSQCGTATRPDGQVAQLACFNGVCWDSCACGGEGCADDTGGGIGGPSPSSPSGGK